MGVFGMASRGSAPSTSCIVAALFIGVVFLSPVKMNWEPGEAMICSSSGFSSSGTVARSQSPKEPCQTRPKTSFDRASPPVFGASFVPN